MNHSIRGWIGFEIPGDSCEPVRLAVEGAIRDLGGTVTGRSLKRDDWVDEIDDLIGVVPIDIKAAIDEWTEEERTDWFNPHAVDAVATVINRTRGEGVPVDVEDRLEAVEALEDARRASMSHE